MMDKYKDYEPEEEDNIKEEESVSGVFLQSCIHQNGIMEYARYHKPGL